MTTDALGSMEARQDALERLGAALYAATVGFLILVIGITLGFVIGMLDIFIGQLLLGRENLVESVLGDRFKALIFDTYRWYVDLLLYIAFGRGNFDWLP